MYNRLKIISLSANVELAKEVAGLLGVNVTKSDLIHFADGEVLFQGTESFRGDNVYIIQSTCAPVNERLMELLVCIDACKRASARSITCIVPYFGYARQDRKAKPRQPITAKLVADMLTVAGADRVVCVDLHSLQLTGFFDIPVDNISALPLIHAYFKDRDPSTTVCVSPDHGGVVRTTKLAERLNCPIAIIDKRRPEPNKAEITAIVGEIEGKDCIIVDDIVDTAGTLCAAADKLIELGAKSVEAVISHGVLSRDAVKKIESSHLRKLVITDSIPLPDIKKSSKIDVMSLAPLLKETIASLEEGRSLSDTFQSFEDKIVG